MLTVNLASQKVPNTLWNLTAHCHVCKCLPSVPIPRQMKPVQTFPSNSFTINPTALEMDI